MGAANEVAIDLITPLHQRAHVFPLKETHVRDTRDIYRADYARLTFSQRHDSKDVFHQSSAEQTNCWS